MIHDDTYEQPLKVTIAWTDPPKVINDASLNNDLDLKVTLDGVDYLPIQEGGGSGVDTINTFEHITISNPTPSTNVEIEISCSQLLDGF